jgi:hypothetical protein
MLSFRRVLSLCACVFSLAACGHPIRDLANGVKGLIPDDDKTAASASAAPTTQIALIANLYADAPLAPAWDAKRPEASSSFIVSASPYTSDGRVVDLRLYFCKIDARSWQWHALATNVGEPGSELGAGELMFGLDGALLGAQLSQALRLPRGDGSLSAPVTLFFGTPQGEDADGFDGVTATGESSRLLSYEQDGGPRD